MRMRVWLALTLTFLPAVAGATDAAQVSKVKEMIHRRICFELFWRGDGQFRGTEADRTWPIEIVIEPDGRFLARVAARGPGFRIPGEEDDWTFFYFGWVRKGQFYLRETSWSLAEEPDRAKFVPPAVVQDVLRFPSFCEPSYEPDTPEKQRMTAKLLRSIQLWLSAPEDPDSPTARKQQVDVWVSKFDPGDPYALVVVQGLPDIFKVSLQSREPKDEETYQQEDTYFVTIPSLGTVPRVDYTRWRRQRKDKVRKYGVKHTIVVALDGRMMRGFRP